MTVTNVVYTPAEGVVEVFDNFAWPGGTAITPVAFESFIRTSMEGCLEQIGELLELNS